MTKERYQRLKDLADFLNDCCDELSFLASDEDLDGGELSDILDDLYSELDKVVSEIRQRLESFSKKFNIKEHEQ